MLSRPNEQLPNEEENKAIKNQTVYSRENPDIPAIHTTSEIKKERCFFM